MVVVDCGEDAIAELIAKIQVFIYPRRIRMRELFVDFDTLRSGRCSLVNFNRALNTAGLSLLDEQIDALADHFTETGPRVQKPQVVNYVKFCQAADEVFDVGSPVHHMSASPSSTVLTTFKPRDEQDEEKFMHVLHRFSMLCKTRGIIVKNCYTDVDRAPTASPSRLSRRRGGQVTRSQFIRLFPFKKEMSEQDLDLLADHFTTESGDVHFMALHNDVSEVIHAEPPPYPRSDLIMRPDYTQWSFSRLNPVEKLRAKVVEKRVRMHEHFQDYDPLRKGLCKASQVRTVFTILNLGREIEQPEFDYLVEIYGREAGQFCYREFCVDVDQEFTKPNLEKEPLTQVTMPDASTTAPARRNKELMSPVRLQLLIDLEDKIRTRVKQRRMLLKPAFEDMDKCHCGHITCNQFSRVMHILGFQLDEGELAVLASAYCDRGTHVDFNYIDFMKSVDPPREEEELAQLQSSAPNQAFIPARYFNSRGEVQSYAAVAAATG